jgi:hypothetical protein
MLIRAVKVPAWIARMLTRAVKMTAWAVTMPTQAVKAAAWVVFLFRTLYKKKTKEKEPFYGRFYPQIL